MYHYTTHFKFLALACEGFTGYVSILFSAEKLWQGCLPEFCASRCHEIIIFWTFY